MKEVDKWNELFNHVPEHDTHAGWAEISLMMYLKPDLVCFCIFIRIYAIKHIKGKKI